MLGKGASSGPTSRESLPEGWFGALQPAALTSCSLQVLRSSGNLEKRAPVLDFPNMPSAARVLSVSGPHWICPLGRMELSDPPISSHSHSFHFVCPGYLIPEAWESKAGL